ncbi:hypothetical protein H6F89_33730 [Cyanobacteria bacterium FACHB-63]|nr:hypothetical protein [Cyanobacteria bacterium FACHB-63]
MSDQQRKNVSWVDLQSLDHLSSVYPQFRGSDVNSASSCDRLHVQQKFQLMRQCVKADESGESAICPDSKRQRSVSRVLGVTAYYKLAI